MSFATTCQVKLLKKLAITTVDKKRARETEKVTQCWNMYHYRWSSTAKHMFHQLFNRNKQTIYSNNLYGLLTYAFLYCVKQTLGVRTGDEFGDSERMGWKIKGFIRDDSLCNHIIVRVVGHPHRPTENPPFNGIEQLYAAMYVLVKLTAQRNEQWNGIMFRLAACRLFYVDSFVLLGPKKMW